MCGRYTLSTDLTRLQQAFPSFSIPTNLTPRYNIAPSQRVPVVVNDGAYQVDFCQWGLIPTWAKEASIGQKMINARAETLAEKPSFRNVYRRRRCLVLADGFYEWSKGEGKGGKTPMHIHLKSGEPFAMAGLWDTWSSPDGSVVPTCTIVTTEPNELVAPLHHRMAVILPPEAYEQWLSPRETSPEELNALLKPYPAEKMAAHAVSKIVNNAKYDVPECMQPVEMLFS